MKDGQGINVQLTQRVMFKGVPKTAGEAPALPIFHLHRHGSGSLGGLGCVAADGHLGEMSLPRSSVTKFVPSLSYFRHTL